MSLIPTPLPSSGPQVTALQNALIALGFTFPSAELGSPGSGVFGPVTQAAVMSFRQNNVRPQIDEALAKAWEEAEAIARGPARTERSGDTRRRGYFGAAGQCWQADEEVGRNISSVRKCCGRDG
jgi:peptidoglycan hydrolase-like protein with peptidoglycan-binding domain